MDEIIPANDKMPSASALGVVSYVRRVLKTNSELITLFKHLLARIESQSQEKFNKKFIEIESARRIVVLENLEEKETKLFNVLKDFTYEGYYINEHVYKMIGYEPHPTGTMGPSMEAFDERLLDRVKNMPPSYINI